MLILYPESYLIKLIENFPFFLTTRRRVLSDFCFFNFFESSCNKTHLIHYFVYFIILCNNRPYCYCALTFAWYLFKNLIFFPIVILFIFPFSISFESLLLLTIITSFKSFQSAIFLKSALNKLPLSIFLILKQFLFSPVAFPVLFITRALYHVFESWLW